MNSLHKPPAMDEVYLRYAVVAAVPDASCK
jgi:hypothetical protein